MVKQLLALSLLFPLVTSGYAQCGACMIGDTCTVDPPLPTVCPPFTLPGTVGVPYSLDVTFWIPPSFLDPITQLNVELDQVVLNSLENLPLGFTYEASSPNLTYYPQQNPIGCVRICGVPMEAGIDTIQIHATVQGTVGGIATTQTYDINLPVVAYPADQDSVADFTASGNAGCEPFAVSFDPLINPPGLSSTFAWAFGNGNTYAGATPPDQTYSTGNYEVTLQTTVAGVFLTQLSITDVNEDWCGDIDEPNLPFVGCTGQPDLYFTVVDAQLGLSRSSVASNTQSHTWNGLSIPLGFPPFTLTVYDDDGISADDVLGSYTFDNIPGTFPFSQGGTDGQRMVQVQTVHVFSYSDSINVLPSPNTTLIFSGSALCATDEDLSAYGWSLNGVLVDGESGPCVLASNGNWTVTGTNAEGCSSSSNYQVIGLGVSEASSKPLLDLFPVPNAGHFTLRGSGWDSPLVELEVRDAMGRLVHAETLVSQAPAFSRTVDLKNVAAGTYSLLLRDGDASMIRSFTVVPH